MYLASNRKIYKMTYMNINDTDHANKLIKYLSKSDFQKPTENYLYVMIDWLFKVITLE